MTWGDTFSEMSSAINCAPVSSQCYDPLTPRVIVRCHNNNQLKQREALGVRLWSLAEMDNVCISATIYL